MRQYVAPVFESFAGKEHSATARLQLQQFLMRCGEFSDAQIWTKESFSRGGPNSFQAFCSEHSVLREICNGTLIGFP